MHRSFFSMKRAFQSSLEWLKKVFEPFGITPARFDMMRAIDSDEYVEQRALQDMLGVSGATVSRMLKALCELGLVESEQDRDDRRRKLLGLTERGAALLREIMAVTTGLGLGGLAIASTIHWYWDRPIILQRAMNELNRRLECIRRGFGDRATLRYGSGFDD